MRLFLTCLLAAASMVGAHAQTLPGRSTGQTLYLPVYSHIWHGDTTASGERAKTLMSVAVSIRNTDLAKPIRVVSAQYYDTDGKKLRNYVTTPQVVAPMGTLELFVPRSDDTGGSGANFIIVWKADQAASAPLVEGIHANLPAGRAIAFISTAKVLPEE
jgi:hypothetical protein